ncbi:hypothetical protein PG2010B_0031 [Bifidobacterium animalis subsp. lactis]|uniref:hypothetical protein n=1 Tax=Bifidobacterium animalis TaxID=28025 RepID=UPI001021E755|nr:hypothetical protein [Bifidobacterium animalis]RYM94943.1 hypothetical protein PG2010B_0031 [Bifidobacterium animalis subsp. lactis]RYM95019.1 hypothetical protein PG2007B_0031 [Bifidobacterium animalis subsp. lactis]
MIARHHLMGAAAQAVTLNAYALAGVYRIHDKPHGAADFTILPEQWLYQSGKAIADRSFMLPTPLIIACVIALLLGALIPDIDNAHTTLGRYFN